VLIGTTQTISRCIAATSNRRQFITKSCGNVTLVVSTDVVVARTRVPLLLLLLLLLMMMTMMLML